MLFVRRHATGLALALTCAWAVVLALTGSADMLFYLAPMLLFAIPLAAGRYLGESLVVKLATRGRRPPRRLARPQSTPRAPSLWLPRGTRLIAFSLAERPPPAAALSLT